MNWSSLNSLGKSGLAKSSYLWILVVPIAAVALEQVQGILQVPLFGRSIPVSLRLPFSWQLFYFASLATSAACAVYAVRCPAIIREYRDLPDYLSRQPSASWLPRHLISIGALGRYDSAETEANVNRLLLTMADKPVVEELILRARDQGVSWLRGRISALQVPDSRVQEAFWITYEHAESSRRVSRWFCAFCFGTGLLLAGVVLLQNCRAVIGASGW